MASWAIGHPHRVSFPWIYRTAAHPAGWSCKRDFDGDHDRTSLRPRPRTGEPLGEDVLLAELTTKGGDDQK
jgi:hypothetical protein